MGTIRFHDNLDKRDENGYNILEGNGNPRAQGREGQEAITTRPSPAQAGRGGFLSVGPNARFKIVSRREE